MTPSKRRNVILLGCIFALCTAGAWIGGQLVKEHAGRWTGDGAKGGLFTRVCEATAGAGFDCTGSINGPWSLIKIPVPVPSLSTVIGLHTVYMPVAFLALAYFVFMGVWFAMVGRPRVYGYRWHRVPLGVGLCGVTVSLFYVGVMATGKAPWCAWCLALHVINLLLVLAIWRLGAGQPLPQSATADARWAHEPAQIARVTTTFRQATTAIAVALILITGLWAYRREHLEFRKRLGDLQPYQAMVKSLQKDPVFLMREFLVQPQRNMPLRAQESTDSSQPQLAVFTDFECRACYCNSHTIRRRNAAAFKGNLHVRVRHFPLDSECNPNVETEIHPNACEAAYAAEAARLQGGDQAFDQMHLLLFRNRKALGDDLYRKLAGQIGIDVARFQADMEGDLVRQIVQSDIEMAEELGVTKTPTMLLNGRRIPELCQVPAFWLAFAEEWNRSALHAVGAEEDNRSVVAASDMRSSKEN